MPPLTDVLQEPETADSLLAFFEGASWLPSALFLGTFVTEDLSCVAGGLLAAEGRVALPVAMAACALGIWVGDVGLYLIGWFTARGLLRWGWARRRLDGLRGNSWSRAFADHGTRILFASRFVPGTRNVCYLTAGAVGWPLPRFMLVMGVAVVLWAPLLVGLSAMSGEVVVELLAGWGAVAWLAVPLALVVAWFVIRTLPLTMSWRGRRILYGRWLRLTRWEYWPPTLVFPPVALDLIRTAIVHRTPAVFTACNCGVPQGGLVGESKGDILDLFGPGDPERVAIARYVRFRGDEHDLPERLAIVRRFLQSGAGCCVLKPDQGEKGAGVAVVRSEAEARAWLEACPFDAMVQEFTPGQEFGVAWSRNPQTGRGEIHSIAHKVLPTVVGDGRRSLEDLILAGERTVAMARHHLAQHADRLEWVPAEGEVVALGDLGTHARGATFFDARALATPELHAAFEDFMADAPDLDFGRFDLRVPSADDLRAGRRIRILEFNGVTGEAAHVYQPGYPWHRGVRDMIAHLRRASAIGAANRARGLRQPAGFRELAGVLWTAWRRPRFEAGVALRSPASRGGESAAGGIPSAPAP